MLPKNYRLSLRTTITSGSTWRRKHLPFFVVAFEKSEPGPRGAVVAGKNVFPKASDRNTVKRKLRAVLVKVFATHKDHNIVLYAKKQSRFASSEELTSTLEHLLSV